MTHQALWYVDRAAGLVTLLLLSVSVVLGAISASRVRSERWPRFALAQIHRNMALLALTFGAVHVLSAVLDTFVPITARDALVPFESAYKPFWLALGTIGADLMLAVLLTSAIRRKIGFRAWKKVHLLSYGVWGAGLMHALGMGTDARTAIWAVVVIAACIGAVAGAVVQKQSVAQPH